MSEIVTAYLEWYLWIRCPKCKQYFDIADYDEDSCLSKPIFTEQWHLLKGKTINCPKCNCGITIDKVEL